MSIDRSCPPHITFTGHVDLPQTRTDILANGIKVMSLRAGSQPVIRLSIVFRAGTRRQNAPFVASAMLNMLSEGSQNMNSADIANTLDFYGIYYDTNIDRDFTVITVSCLNKFLPQTIDLLEEILLRPIFDPEELATYAAKRKQNIRIERQKPSFIAREKFAAAIFGSDHPYGVSSDESGYDRLTPELLREHYQKYYTADNAFAVTSGMVDTEQLSLISDFLTKIPRGNKPEEATLPDAESIGQLSVEREDALQSCIRMGRVLFPKNHPDYSAMQILGMVLGGYFGSRLVKNLREDHGYTYGAYSTMVNLEHSGYFAVATDVASQHRDDAIRQIRMEMERLRTEPIPDDELDMVRNTIIGEMMRLADGPFGVADITIESEQCGRDNDMFNEFLERVKTITPAELQKIAIQYLDPDAMTTVTIG